MVYLSQEERDARNKTFRELGFRWKKEGSAWFLLNSNDERVNPEQAWFDIQNNKEKYQEQREQRQKQAIARACELIQSGAVILDTESTGSNAVFEELIDIAIVDMVGNILVNTFVQCTGVISSEAYTVHGISKDMLVDAPTFPEVWTHIEPLINGRELVIYNAPFDIGLLSKGIQHYGLSQLHCDTSCLMKLYIAIEGEGRYRLSDACTCYGIPAIPNHRAYGDAESARQLLHALAKQEKPF